MSPDGRTAIVTPVYEDREAAGRLFSELGRLCINVFVVAVDDGSVRQPLDVASLQEAGVDGVVIRLTRNVGHQRAIAIGLSYVAEEMPDAPRVVTMDSDGEDVPQSILELMVRLESADVDVVVARRKKRTETMRFRLFYAVYKALFRILTGRQIDFGNFIAFKMPAVVRITHMQEVWIHVAGCVLTSKLRIAKCALDRGTRFSGSSKMNFRGLVLHGFRALMIFAEDVLVRVGLFCLAVAALSLLGVVSTIVLKLLGFATPGWFSTALGLLILILFQTGALTLITLMFTGLVKGVSPPIDYRILVADVLPTREQ
jgi:glycosyltransferase involved in cell wall biosynthesis